MRWRLGPQVAELWLSTGVGVWSLAGMAPLDLSQYDALAVFSDGMMGWHFARQQAN